MKDAKNWGLFMNNPDINTNAIANDLFCIPFKDDLYILYRPSLHSIALVDSNAANNLSTFLNFPDQNSNFFDILNNSKLQGFLSLPEHVFEIDQPLIEPEAEFTPYEVTLDITWKCNLKCIYCYANGGENPVNMDWECATAAIDLCVANCSRDKKPFVLRFHGNGEPTQNWKMLKNLVEYGKGRAQKNNISFSSSIATNGVISNKQASWIAENIEAISLSFDGNANSQNTHRPTVSGKNSYSAISRTLKYWNEINKQFNIRTTVTKINVEQLSEICLELGELYKNSIINLEPMAVCGRANNVPEMIPDPETFATNYAKAFVNSTRKGIKVSYSGIRGFTLRRYFCGASMPNFSVMADGRVTACFSYSSQDFRRDLFVYGIWDKERKKFTFYPKIISQLRKLSIDRDPYCNNCFVKYHCTGDCPAIRSYDLLNDKYFVEKFDVDLGKNRRCKINRSIMKFLLIELLKKEGVIK